MVTEAAALPNVLELKKVCKTFITPDGKTFDAIKNVNLEVADLPGAGEFRVFLGPSGCGKSTILNIVAGLFAPTTGQALLRNKPIAGPGPERGMVFQGYSSYPWLTVLDNVAFGMMLRGVPRAEREREARSWIEKVGLKGAEKKYPKQLSGGMRQRVAIARTLAVKPQIILMDEPFGALDEQTRLLMGEWLVGVRRTTRKTIVFVTHSLHEAIALSDRIVVMTARPGRVKDVIDVALPYPRDLNGPEVTDLRAKLWEQVREESLKAMAGNA